MHFHALTDRNLLTALAFFLHSATWLLCVLLPCCYEPVFVEESDIGGAG